MPAARLMITRDILHRLVDEKTRGRIKADEKAALAFDRAQITQKL